MPETDRVALWAYKLARDLHDCLVLDGVTLPAPWRETLCVDVAETLRSVRAYFHEDQPRPQEGHHAPTS